ncbi:MAG: hypothetical protein ACRBBN_10745 [Methyloligellaceae bacterium]
MSLHFKKCITAFTTILLLLAGNSSLAIAENKRATILLLLQPHKASGERWDLGQGADPMICLKHGCYTGRGFLAPAKYYKGTKAFLPAVQARACRNSLTCVYRKVTIPVGRQSIWPIDHDVFNSDRMQKSSANLDYTCRIESKQLQCSEGIFTREYSMWIVPEEVADQAGRKALDYALFKGLYEARQKKMRTFIKRQYQQLSSTVEQFFHSVLDRPVPRKCFSDPELIVEALYISGIFDSQKRESSSYIRQFINAEYQKEDHVENTLSSGKFWKFHDGLKKLETYTEVDNYRIIPHQKGLKLITEGESTTLMIGGDVRSRTENALAACITSEKIASDNTR